MRIVGGELGGRRFRGPPPGATRPTAERVREAVASALDARDAIAGRVVLDLFAGTGALAFEALSRGATRAVLVERERRVATAADRSAGELGLASRVRVLVLDLARDPDRAAELCARSGPFGLVFLDPPYAEVDAVPALLDALIAAGAIEPGAKIVIEHAARDAAPVVQGLASVAAYRYGDTAVTMLELANEAR